MTIQQPFTIPGAIYLLARVLAAKTIYESVTAGPVRTDAYRYLVSLVQKAQYEEKEIP